MKMSRLEQLGCKKITWQLKLKVALREKDTEMVALCNKNLRHVRKLIAEEMERLKNQRAA